MTTKYDKEYYDEITEEDSWAKEKTDRYTDAHTAFNRLINAATAVSSDELMLIPDEVFYIN